MSTKQDAEPIPSAVEQPLRANQPAHRTPEDFGVWLNSRQAALYVGSKSLKAFYQWAKRHFVIAQGRTYARRDLDRAKNAKRAPRRMAAASLANLRKRVG